MFKTGEQKQDAAFCLLCQEGQVQIYEKITFNVPFMAQPADEVTVPPESKAYTALSI